VCALAVLLPGQAILLSIALAGGIIALFFTGSAAESLRPRDIMPIAVFAALAAAGQGIFAAIPAVKPVGALAIAGMYFGSRSGFMTGALSMLISGVLLGFGPFTPWQMTAMGLMGHVGGILGNWLRRRPVAAAAAGFILAFLYGIIMDTYHIIGFTGVSTPGAALAVYGAGLVFNITFAVSTAVFLGAAAASWDKKLTRLKTKFDLGL